jgi:hypothetical protein
MPQVTTVQLLPQRAFPGPTGSTYEWYGDRQQAAAYYLANRDLQTIVWATSNLQNSNPSYNFIGNITIQASISTEPGASDWFDVYDINTNQYSGTHNLQGNYVWLRAHVYNWTQGIINSVYASY